MKHRLIAAACAAAALSLTPGGMARAYSIVNVPTANQAALREVNVAYYSLNMTKLGVTHKDIGIIYSTVAPNLELEWIHVDVNRGWPTQELINATYKVVKESKAYPDVVLGVKNIFGDDTSPDPDEKRVSYYVATAKTLNPPKPGQKWTPVVRLHVSYGTREHRGLFGGVQVAITPRLGLAAMKFTNSPYVPIFFGHSSEYALVYSLGKKAPNLKAGTLGRHSWVGIDYSLHY